MAPVWGQTLVLVLMIGMTAWFQGNVARANRSASAASAQVIEASEVRALSRAIQRDSLKLTIEVWNDRRKDLRDSIDARGQQLLVRARKLAEMVGQDDVDFSHDFVALQETVVKEIGAVETAALSNDVAGARENFIKRVEPAEKAASKKTDAFIDAGEARAQALAAAADRTQTSAQWTILLVGVAAALVGLGGSSLVAYAGIIFPLRRVMASMARVSAGDRESPIDGLERGDEIGDVAKAVATIRDAEIEGRVSRVRRRRSAPPPNGSASARRRRLAETRRNSPPWSTRSPTASQEFAKDDLTERIEAEFKGRFQQIKTDFNASVAKLENAMKGVVVSAGAITSGSQQISTASDDLSPRTEQQAASLEETAAALGEITRDGEEIRARRQPRQRSGGRRPRSPARRAGADVVGKAVAAMAEIAKSTPARSARSSASSTRSRFKPTCSTLNAGVEAARAGEAGRQFAVVASEVL